MMHTLTVHPPPETVYYFEKNKLKEVRRSVAGGKADLLHTAYEVQKGVRTRHPHVPADSAMGRVMAGSWKAYER